MKRAEEESIGDLLNQFLKINQLENHVYEVKIAEVWQEVLGDAITRETERIHLWSGSLFVCLKSPALKHELIMRRSTIARQLNEKLGSDVIKQVVIR